MTMDLISGLAIIASVSMLAVALVAVLATRGLREDAVHVDAAAVHSIAARVLATVVVVFFITAANLLLIAQQISLALGTFVVGLLLVVVLYLEPSLSGGRRQVAEDKEGWRR